MSDNKEREYLSDVLTEKIFSIRSNRLVTIVADDKFFQVKLPKFIKKDNLESVKNELGTCLSNATKARSACVIVRIVNKDDILIAGLGIIGDSCEYYSANTVRECFEKAKDDGMIEFTDDVKYCDFNSIVE